jgi:glutamine amidotransferase
LWLLAYLPCGQQPDLSALRTGATSNPDGHGYAIVVPARTDSAGERLHVVKGLDAEVVLDRLDHDRRTHPDGPALFHSRLRTHGRYLFNQASGIWDDGLVLQQLLPTPTDPSA